MKILFVEDEPVNQFIAQKYFQKWSFKITFASNGKMALQKVKDEHFDLIFMDLQMPIMDGLEATKIIRNLPAPKSKTPIVLLTASLLSTIELKIGNKLFDDIMIKPFDLQKIEAIFEKHCLTTL